MIENITSDIEKRTSEITYKRALSALPILVRQVIIAKMIDDRDITMTYRELGEEIDAHHRVVRYPLYCIEKLLAKLGEHWKEEIPAIQGIVVNQNSRLPGNNVKFLRGKKPDIHSKKALVKENFTGVIKYKKWMDVLQALGLPMPKIISCQRLQAAAQCTSIHESQAHKNLKNHVAQNPQCVGVDESLAPGKIEYRLPSGDILDVLFENDQQSIAVEVKSRISNENDLLRGLYQCVKYRAVLKAHRSLDITTHNVDVDARLVIEGTLSKDLIDVKDIFGVKVVESIQVSNV